VAAVCELEKLPLPEAAGEPGCDGAKSRVAVRAGDVPGFVEPLPNNVRLERRHPELGPRSPVPRRATASGSATGERWVCEALARHGALAAASFTAAMRPPQIWYLCQNRALGQGSAMYWN
jgi:hypothetical protein